MLDITLAQLNPIVGDIDFNRDKIISTCQDLGSKSDLVLFPEMMLCGYPPEDLVLKPSFIDALNTAAGEIIEASENFETALILPMPWHKDGKLYNAAHLIQNGKILDTIYKHHLPNYGTFDEMRLFTAGHLPKPIEFNGHKLGLMICEDMWYDDVAKHLKQHDAEMLLVINASPYSAEKASIRESLARERCLETGLPLLYVNQCGGQDELVFDGASFALSESGTLLEKFDIFVEETKIMHWQKTKNNNWICDTDFPDRTPNEKEEEIYRALVTGLRDYVDKNGFNGVLIGLSGGIDSAMAATIATDALGAERVHCVMMPSEYTSQESLDDAAAIAKNLGVHYEITPIKDAVKSFNETLAPHFTADTPESTFENIQSRCRGLILMTLSNATGKMVLSAGNKSEMATGYATLYGDMCGGFNVLKDVYKTELYKLAAWRNKQKPEHSFGPQGIVITENVITKEPSAELKPDQRDQDSLPVYKVLDDILRALIEEDLDIDDIVERGHEADTARKIWRLLDRAEYKRRQAPPGPKITTRNFGRDRRYPITNHFLKIIEK